MTNLTDGDACLMSGTTLAAVKDTLAKLALIGSMVMCFAIIIALVGRLVSPPRAIHRNS